MALDGSRRRTLGWCLVAVAAAWLLVWQLVCAEGGTPDPASPDEHLLRAGAPPPVSVRPATLPGK